MPGESSQMLNQGSLNVSNPTDVLCQVANLINKVYGFEIKMLGDGRFFKSTKAENDHKGVQSVTVRLEDEPVVRVKLEWLRTSVEIAPSMGIFWKHLSGLSEGVRPLPPVTSSGSGTTSYWLELRVQAASILGMSRISALSAELEAIDNLAIWFQSELPRPLKMADLDRLYADHAQLVKPIYPYQLPENEPVSELSQWSEKVMSLLSSSLNVALSAESQILQEIAMAAIAAEAMKVGSTISMVQPPALSAKNIIEISKQVPGRIVVQTSRISIGSSPYEMGDQIQCLLSILASAGTPVIFVGSYQQLQTIFHGGQGGMSDPLMPAVVHAPELSFDAMVRFALQTTAQQVGGISDEKLAELHTSIVNALSHLSTADRVRILAATAAHGIAHRCSHVSGTDGSITEFVSQVSEMTETLAGMQQKPRARRRPKVQENLVSNLLSPGLLPYLTSELFAQDEALEQLVYRLQTECLTRSDHQPIRYCAQGTPGIGKSESVALLARFLNIPHINIDAASQPDYHTASAQLLGSGRGIVGSYEAGRLEKAAKHSAGAVLEISDLDHAPLAVRGHLADLFLQVLDTGEAQSATGAVFSCANLIFAFTINLPEGRDEQLYRGIGFDGSRSRTSVQQYVEKEIKLLFSNAFLSRIGRPILFSPLGGSDLALIAEREILKSLGRGLGVLGVSVAMIDLKPGMGATIIESMGSGLLSHGARVVAEHARLLVTQALLTFKHVVKNCTEKTLAVRIKQNSTLAITISD